ncbi:MAG: hypothetical protein K5821_11435 [Nitrobacter sp.]|uniref:hypothetical protein n=1 Tax=Nitrobacter sp. TaxID=29420 RepID=UPI002613D63F|nr:hypothetical protein [Nitrobacter sp.]MCV0387028.1 hypothetical protein [Nitrobacter sp.]
MARLKPFLKENGFFLDLPETTGTTHLTALSGERRPEDRMSARHQRAKLAGALA